MQKIPTLYSSYQELILDLDIYGKIISTPQQSLPELRETLFEEFKRRKPLPTLEAKRYELSRLVSQEYRILYTKELELQENESLVDLNSSTSSHNLPTFDDLEPLIPEVVQVFSYENQITDDIRNTIVEKYDLKTGEEFKPGVHQTEKIFGSTKESTSTILTDDEIEKLGYTSIDIELDDGIDIEETHSFVQSEVEDVVPLVPTEVSVDFGEEEIYPEDYTEDEIDDYTEYEDTEEEYVDYTEDEVINEEIVNEDDSDDYTEYEDDSDDYTEYEDDIDDYSSYENDSDDIDDYSSYEEDGQDDYESYDDSSDNTDDYSSYDDTSDEEVDDYSSYDETSDEEVDDYSSYDDTSDDEEVDDYSSYNEETNGVSETDLYDIDDVEMEFTDTVVEEDEFLSDVEFIDNSHLVKEVQTPVTPAQIHNEIPKEEVIDRSSEPTDIRQFLRKHPRCEYSFALKYFTKKQISDAIKVGKIIKKGNILKI